MPSQEGENSRKVLGAMSMVEARVGDGGVEAEGMSGAGDSLEGEWMSRVGRERNWGLGTWFTPLWWKSGQMTE